MSNNFDKVQIIFGKKHNLKIDGKYLKQAHTNKVVIVTDHLQKTETVEGDALVTKVPNIKLCIKTADCVPILLTSNKVVAAAHIGWRGAFSSIIQNTVTVMNELGSSKIRAFIGPCIRQKNYNIDKEFKEKFLEQDKENEQFFDDLQFDLPSYCKNNLYKLGVVDISDEGVNTYSNPHDYFSYRYYTNNQLELGKDDRQFSQVSLTKIND